MERLELAVTMSQCEIVGFGDALVGLVCWVDAGVGAVVCTFAHVCGCLLRAIAVAGELLHIHERGPNVHSIIIHFIVSLED